MAYLDVVLQSHHHHQHHNTAFCTWTYSVSLVSPPSVIVCHFIAAVVYLELWKRYSANLIYRWGLVQFCSQAEHARPDYLAKLRTAKKQVFNFDTKVSEPRVPFWKKKFPMYLFSFSVVFLFVSLKLLVKYSRIAILHFHVGQSQ